MAETPALLISTLGHHGDMQSGTRLLVYGYKGQKAPRIYLHATDPTDGRYKGHTIKMRTTEYEAMLGRIQRAKGYPLVHFGKGIIEVENLEPDVNQKGNVGFTSEARRPIVGVWIDKKELSAALKAMQKVEHALTELTQIDI